MTAVIPRPTRTSVAALIGVAVLLSTGCAKTGTVSGKVTLPDGSPLPGGIISFVPEDSSRNPATATIGEDGTYSAVVPTGPCKVSIDNRMAGQRHVPIGAGGMPTKVGGNASKAGAKIPGMPKGMVPPGAGAQAPPQVKDAQKKELEEELKEKGAPPVEGVVRVPGKVVPINPKYSVPDTSGLTLTVSGGSNMFDVKLEK